MESSYRFDDGSTDARWRLWLANMIDRANSPERRGQFYRLDGNDELARFFGTFLQPID